VLNRFCIGFLSLIIFVNFASIAYAQTTAAPTPNACEDNCSFLQAVGKCTLLQPIANNEYQMGGVLYMQKAAEYRALAYQAFNIARTMLDLDLQVSKKMRKGSRKVAPAVVVDVDETVLNNSEVLAYFVRHRMAYVPDAFTEWVNLKQATAIPGAVDFLSYAAQHGVKVFYVTSRNMKERLGTIENLKSLGFPDPSDETVLVRTDTSSKEPRRQLIMQKYRIVLLIGDNLNDLSQVFENRKIDDRFIEVDKVREQFGKHFIVLPNAIYGAWEDAIYEYNRELSDREKDEKRNAALQVMNFGTPQ
jgi:5'-nucleotidase (lipoprotein e(P4) family)